MSYVFELLPVESLSPNPFRVRLSLDKENLLALAESIRRFGVLTPIVVGNTAAGKQIIAGERRWRAAKIAGLKEIPAVILQVNTHYDLALLALAENVHRDQLNLVEQALTLKRMREQFNLEMEEVANATGMPEEQIILLLKVLDLPEEIKEAYLDGKVTDVRLFELLEIDDPIVLMHEIGS